MGGSCSTSSRYVHAANDIASTDFSLYQIIGHGEFGKVFVGVHHSSCELLAIKQIDLIKIWESGMKTTMIHNELNALRMIGKHPFTAELAFSLLDQGVCYVALNLLEGGCLREHMASTSFCEQSVAFIIVCIDSALRHVHGRGILHRDIKPANIVMDAHGFPCLVDFGIAFIRSREDEISGRPLSCRMTSGTEAYCAPELLTRSHEHGIEAEYWSLGVMAFELIFGYRPFRRKVSSSFVKYIERQREQERIKQDLSGQDCSSIMYTSALASYSQSAKSGKSFSARTANVGKANRCHHDSSIDGVDELEGSVSIRKRSLLVPGESERQISYVEDFEEEINQMSVDEEDTEQQTEEDMEDKRMLRQCHIIIPNSTRWNTPTSPALEDFLRGIMEARIDRRVGGANTPINSTEWMEQQNLPPIEELQRKTILPPSALAKCVYRHVNHTRLTPDDNCKKKMTIDSSRAIITRALSWDRPRPLSPRTKKIHSEIGEYNYVAPKYRRPQHS
jgi:serine/threonine protein kinase